MGVREGKAGDGALPSANGIYMLLGMGEMLKASKSMIL